MSDPLDPLQGWIVAALKAAATGAGDNVFDQVGPANPFPRITIGPGQVLPGDDDAACGATFEVFQQIDVWSRSVGFPQVKAIAGQVRASLHNAAPALAGFTVVLFEWRGTDYLRDPDGLTSRARLQFRALIDAAA